MTAKQMKVFWPVFAAACRNLGIENKAGRDAYRADLMWEASRARHLKDVGETRGFEILMVRVAADSGDYRLASQYTIGDERRMGAMIDDCTRQVIELNAGAKSDSAADRIAYVSGILEQAGLTRVRVNSPRWWMDFDAEKPVKVFQILDTHRRRLLRRRGVTSGLGYRFGKEYEKVPSSN